MSKKSLTISSQKPSMYVKTGGKGLEASLDAGKGVVKFDKK